ncbi:hypothetical protein ACLKA6_008431 [Drosophila palustris]
MAKNVEEDIEDAEETDKDDAEEQVNEDAEETNSTDSAEYYSPEEIEQLPESHSNDVIPKYGPGRPRIGKTSQSKPGQYTFGVHEESPGYGPQLHKRGPGGYVSSLGRLGRPAKFRGPKSCQTVATLLADSC